MELLIIYALVTLFVIVLLSVLARANRAKLNRESVKKFNGCENRED